MLSGFVGLVISITGVVAAVFALLSEELKSNKMVRYSVVGALFALSAYSVAGSLIALSASSDVGIIDESGSDQITVAADSRKFWQSTGLAVEQGDSIALQVDAGYWTTGRRELSPSQKIGLDDYYDHLQVFVNVQYEQAGTGLPGTCESYNVRSCPVPDAPWGALVARIGNGVPFKVGNSANIVASEDGVLLLTINDDPSTLDQNFGVLIVDIGRN